VKTPKAITHEGSLDHRIKEMREFLAVMRAFGLKLAVVLIQLPPSCHIDQFEALERLLKQLPDDVRFAVEFRNASWGQQRTLDLLREHRCALVTAEYQTRPSRIRVTTDLLYIRWIGEHERFEELNHEQVDMGPQLEWWRGEVSRVMAAERIENVWGFFNNDYAGYAIATCRRFMRIMGLAIQEDAEGAREEQGNLFG
jgi:uncharacterized protein YecE (DUF72 family)